MFFFGPPNILRLKEKGNIKGLYKALSFQKDWQIRQDAATALGELRVNDAKDVIAERLTCDDNIYVKYAAIAALEKLDWVPLNDRASAWYWCLKLNFTKLKDCGVHAIEPLLPLIIDGNLDAMKCYSLLGQSSLEILILCTNNVFQQYKNFTSGVTSLNFMIDEDRRKSAIIAKLSESLGNCVKTIGMYVHQHSQEYLIQLYSQVKNSIYSHADGGFSDMFKANDVRMKIVSSLEHQSSNTVLLQFLADVIEKDPSQLVKWQAADVVASLASISLCNIKNSSIEYALKDLVQNLQEKVGLGQANNTINSRLTCFSTLLNRLRS